MGYESSPLYNENVARLMANPNDYGQYNPVRDDDNDDDDLDDNDVGNRGLMARSNGNMLPNMEHDDTLNIVVENVPSNESRNGMQAMSTDIGADDEDDEDDDDDLDESGCPMTQNLARSSKDGESQLLTPPSTITNITPQVSSQPSMSRKRMSRHKGHASSDRIPNIGSIQMHSPTADYMQMDDEEDGGRGAAEWNEQKRKKEGLNLMKGMKQFMNAITKKGDKGMENKKVGLLQHDIHMDDMGRIEDDTDSDTAHLENEFAAYQSHMEDDDDGGRGRGGRVTYGDDHDNYNKMILGTGDDDDDDSMGL